MEKILCESLQEFLLLKEEYSEESLKQDFLAIAKKKGIKKKTVKKIFEPIYQQ